MLAISLLLAGCGSPANLEEYINSNEELAQEIESYSTAGMSIDVSENTLTYTYKYTQVFDEATGKLVKKRIRNNEQEVYEEKLKRLPKVGAIVKTEDGEGIVEGLETLKEKVRVKLKDGDGYFYKKLYFFSLQP